MMITSAALSRTRSSSPHEAISSSLAILRVDSRRRLVLREVFSRDMTFVESFATASNTMYDSRDRKDEVNHHISREKVE